MKFAHKNGLERSFARSEWWKQLEDNLSKGHSEKVLSMLNENGASKKVDERGYSPLHYAARADDVIVTRYLLNDCCIPVNLKNNANIPPVSVAVVYNSSRVLKLLLEAGAVRKNVHFIRNEGLLHKALSYSSLESIDVLLNFGIKSSEVDADLWTPLHWGMARKEFKDNNPRYVDCIRRIICSLTMDKINAQDGDGRTALYIACSSGYHRGVEELLNAGADIEINSYDLWTPLHIALNFNELDIARLLIKAGANVNRVQIIEDRPHTYLAFVAHSGYRKISSLVHPGNKEPRNGEFFRKIKDQWNKTYEAAKIFLTEARADVETPDTYNFTVAYACNSFNFELMKLLFNNGAPDDRNLVECCISPEYMLPTYYQEFSDKTIERRTGRDMIDYQKKCIKFILSRGIRVDNTPPNYLVSMAMNVCHNKIIRLLLNNGAVFDFNDENGDLANVRYPKKSDAWHEIIRYTAKMQNRRNAPLNFQFDKLAEGLQNFYLECTEELERMENELCWKEGRVTYCNLLTDRDITALARNDNLMLEVDSFDVKRCFPIYCDELMERIAEAKERQRLMDSAAEAFCRLIPIDENPMIFDNIFKYLWDFDLKALSLTKVENI